VKYPLLQGNTVLMFTGDNGTGGEGKGQPTELGARVPMIVNGPGLVQPVGLSAALVDTSDVMPTLAELAGAKLPPEHLIDGASFAPILRGQRAAVREWIFSYLGDRRVLRTQRWLLERNAPYDFGQLYDCGDRWGGTGYRDVTNSTAPEVLAIKRQFEAILATKPVPEIPAAKRPQKTDRKRNNVPQRDNE
jgi:arylsulfatase A